MARRWTLIVLALLAFAANSLLARAALGGGQADAAGFTAIRLVSGAAALAVLMLRGGGRAAGSLVSAGCLFVYALSFSLAYLRLGAATGALILFAAVQACMIGWGLVRGERPGGLALAGLGIALAAFAGLLLPGLQTPDLVGSVLMVAAGLAWGVYSLRGQASHSALADTAGNFVRAAVFALPLAVVLGSFGTVSFMGLVLAVASGAVTSGVGYAVWYAVLPGLRPIQAASLQLLVPIIATGGAVVLLGEGPTLRLLVCGGLILGGVGMTMAARR